MPDPTTTNRGFTIPNRGADIGTWDTPVNGNMSLLDTILGGVSTVALTNVNVTLNAGQAANGVIKFTGALSGNVIITFPAVSAWWTVDNRCTGNFSIALTCGGNRIGCPYGANDIYADGTNMNYRNLGKVGEYWDYGGSTVPLWVSVSTVPPYLNCDGTVFNAGTYPLLNLIFGGNTLPDLRGRTRFALNQTTGRITTAGGGIDGNTLFAAGGVQGLTIGQTNLPNYNLTVTDPGHHHTATAATEGTAVAATGGSGKSYANNSTITTSTATTGISVGSGGSGTALASLPPAVIYGITMVRAA